MEIDEKGSGDDEAEGDKKRDAGRTADTKGGIVEQDHPGHGHSGVPGRTGPACGRPQTNKCSLISGLHVEACCITPSRAIAGRAVMIEFVASRSNEWCSFAATLVLP